MLVKLHPKWMATHPSGTDWEFGIMKNLTNNNESVYAQIGKHLDDKIAIIKILQCMASDVLYVCIINS